MISYTRDPQQTIPDSAVKIIGLGGAGTNMLERIALNGMEGAELLALNTDVRTLTACPAQGKIQLGVNLTRGLGTGGDPELGRQAVLEAEDEIRASIKGRRIIFLCAGLGGGTGSGAAPIVTRIAREEGAFVVVFATMPFAFEGKRRREQAETVLNELAVLSSALVTFDNNRMGELVLAQQGIHEAFAAADHMICESIKAVIRLVVRPGLINIGLDDLISALRTNRSRCLFGSGIATGKDRATDALTNALNSPLLDQGSLLKDAKTVLVHLSGGENLTLFEIELLMQRLQQFVPEKAQVLFGAAIDPAMGDSLSITLISALPEDSLSQEFAPLPTVVVDSVAEPEPAPLAEPAAKELKELAPLPDPSPAPPELEIVTAEPAAGEEVPAEAMAEAPPAPEDSAKVQAAAAKPAPSDAENAVPQLTNFTTGPKRRPLLTAPWGKAKPAEFPEDLPEEETQAAAESPPAPAAPPAEPEPPKLKLGIKPAGSQSELSLDSAPRGRFDGETPNVFEGEDLDLPPFLRKKK